MSETESPSAFGLNRIQIILVGIICFALGGFVFTVAPKVFPKDNCKNLRTQVQIEESNLSVLWDKYQTTRQQVIDASRPDYPSVNSKTISPRAVALYVSNLHELDLMSKNPECLTNIATLNTEISKVKFGIPIMEKATDLEFSWVDPYPRVKSFIDLLKVKN